MTGVKIQASCFLGFNTLPSFSAQSSEPVALNSIPRNKCVCFKYHISSELNLTKVPEIQIWIPMAQLPELTSW